MNREQARHWLVEYEERNDDLHSSTRRLLGLFALAQYAPSAVVWEIAGYETSSFRVDAGRRWWTILATSGLSSHWPAVKAIGQEHGSYGVQRWAMDKLPDKVELLEQRSGIQRFRRRTVPNRRSSFIWTKGGNWHVDRTMTKIVVRNIHVEGRHLLEPWQRRLGEYGIHLVEEELSRLIDPDSMPRPHIQWRVVEYTRRRIAELLHLEQPMSLSSVAWFLQEDIPTKRGYVPGRVSPYSGIKEYVDPTGRLWREWR